MLHDTNLYKLSLYKRHLRQYAHGEVLPGYMLTP